MYREINEEIYELKERLRAKEKLDSLRELTIEELEKKKRNGEDLRNILKKEEKDVTKLEGMSVSSIFLTMIGKKDDQLYKEREEYLAARIRYEECLKDIAELEVQVEYCDNELESFLGVKREYEKVMKEKETLILKEDSDESRKLRDYQDKLNELKLDTKEIKEAINAGEKANISLLVMKEYLDKAKSWGLWDMMGGGLISNIAKHSAIDDANRAGQDAGQSLKVFKKELSDVNKFTDVEVNMSSFTKFADFFFDGFFVDWFVQSKINDSLSNVYNTKSRIDSIISDLNENLSQIYKEQRLLESEIKKLLER